MRYTNLPKIHDERAKGDLDYLSYLDKFNFFFQIPEAHKDSKAYLDYINDLWKYLSDFFGRIQPLVDFEETAADWETNFESKWAAGEISGWKNTGSENCPKNALSLGLFNSPSELEALGMDRLKAALQAEGLKCGGTLKDRAQRLWSTRGVKNADIPAKLKAAANGTDNASEARKSTAWTEHRIACLSEALSDVISSTRKHAEKQQTRTLEEKEAEIVEEEYGTLPEVGEEEEDHAPDDEGPLYNPLNLPLGWDGKPIPYWLYKLHGLGVEYKCEICGNQSYWGRRAFDKHFQEWRHAHGMRCLGIPNTKHFHDITLIEDALTLHSKIKGTMKVERTAFGDGGEEFEDSEGNVMNRKLYEDMARQGLL
jgi:splicing factor 3A subunit 3